MGDDEGVLGLECQLNVYLASKSIYDLICGFEDVYPPWISGDLFQSASSEDVPAIGMPITREFYAQLL